VGTVGVQEESSKTKAVMPVIVVIALRNMTGILPKIGVEEKRAMSLSLPVFGVLYRRGELSAEA
jgi:hypothetical protein